MLNDKQWSKEKAESTFPKTAQGEAKLIKDDEVTLNKEDVDRDNLGFTNLNLHRRIDAKKPRESSQETSERQYILGVSNVNSYRTVKIVTHDEESSTSEVP